MKLIKDDLINGEIFHVHRRQDSILLRHHSFPIWSRDSTQSQSKSQQVILWVNWF